MLEAPEIRLGHEARYRQCPICGYGQAAVWGLMLQGDWHVCRRGPHKALWMILWEPA